MFTLPPYLCVADSSDKTDATLYCPNFTPIYYSKQSLECEGFNNLECDNKQTNTNGEMPILAISPWWYKKPANPYINLYIFE